ncbi:hypothetical protein [Flavivirga spongiicola]|uniref:HTH luxR-type domain-containing protein n=1 Tax=Flavivirga spongiicola TaxID=421621 RepID=A0ABU7XQR4_9FLAO|nr:hypothetical protein [Flavivirga sp. MEBiC05379]MDO5978127.1 hypothetical protein [Flavivirga sp. MEBiC05379]
MRNLNSLDFQKTFEVELIKPNLKRVFGDRGLLDLLVYSYNISNDKFKLISLSFGYKNFTHTNLKTLLHTISPCFRNYFIEFFALYLQFISEKQSKNAKYSLQAFLPMKLKENESFFATLYILPEVIDYKIVELHFVLLPLKVYNKEVITITVLKDLKKDYNITRKVKNEIQLEKILTHEQTKIADLLHKGCSSKEISDRLNKKHDNILKYNIRIKDRLSVFFNVKFDTAKEAVNYYKSCF